MAEGIDIYSANQTVTDWNAVKAAGISWCYQKVSDGITVRTAQKVKEGQKAGVLQGGYHFSQPGSATDQARLLLSQCYKYNLWDLAPCLDLEDNPPSLNKPDIPDSQKAAFAVAFGLEILASGNSYTLYANDSTWKIITNYVMSHLPDTFRWVARYRSAPPDSYYHAWQYSSTGSAPGIVSQGLDRTRGSIPLNKGNNVALTDTELAIINKILSNTNYTAAVEARYPDGQWGGGVGTDGKPDGTYDVAENVRRLIRTQGELSAKIDKIVVGGVDLDALAKKVADLLAARLKD